MSKVGNRYVSISEFCKEFPISYKYFYKVLVAYGYLKRNTTIDNRIAYAIGAALGTYVGYLISHLISK